MRVNQPIMDGLNEELVKAGIGYSHDLVMSRPYGMVAITQDDGDLIINCVGVVTANNYDC